MVFDPNKQIVPPPPPAPAVRVLVGDWTLGNKAGVGCVPPPAGLLSPLVLSLLDDFPAFKRYEPVPQPPWGIVQLIATGPGFWNLTTSYNAGPGAHITAAWQGPAFAGHPSPAGPYFFNAACTQDSVLTIG